MRRSARVAVSVALLIGAISILQLRSTGEAVPIRKSLELFPNSVEEWQGRGDVLLESDVLGVLKAKDYVMRRYQDPEGRNLWLFVAYWDSQRKGAQPHSPKNCLPGAGWEPLEVSRLTVPLAAPFGPIRVNRFLIQKDSAQQLVFYWYQARGAAIASEIEAKVEMVKGSILHRRTDGALVRVSSPVYGNVAQTTEMVTKYIQALYPLLGHYLPD